MAQYSVGGGGTTGTTETTEKVYKLKTQTSGVYKYIGEAEPGTAQSTAGWRCYRIDLTDSANPLTVYADGDENFDNVATDLTALTYS